MYETKYFNTIILVGFIFNLDNYTALSECIRAGAYATKIKDQGSHFSIPAEATFSDYMLMRPGDHVYFFSDRRIYGVGRMVDLGGGCSFKNYLEACEPQTTHLVDMKQVPLFGPVLEAHYMRWLCLFEPSPHFFRNGVDMDDALSSNPPAFRTLRAFLNRSFIMVDEEEDKALMDIILKRNEGEIAHPVHVFSHDRYRRGRIENRLVVDHNLRASEVMDQCADGSRLKHEMALEAGTLEAIMSGHTLFGQWDRLFHQVIASPFKPINWMDRMDVFGYRTIPGFSNTISKYLVIEIKRDRVDKGTIDQVMKYVDWIEHEYAHGDYSMVEAFVLGYEYPQEVVEYRDKIAIRNYIRGRRPTISDTWTSLRLIRYRYDQNKKQLYFNDVETTPP